MPPLTPKQIQPSDFLAALRRYPSLVPASLSALDEARYATIPAALASRRPAPALTHAELVTLVEWKLKHGTFRPTLLSLVRQNASDLVATTTARAFAELLSSGGEEEEGEGGRQGVLRALKALTALRGVGPATASLVLSCAEPGAVPFFGDEVFRWVFWDAAEVKGKGTGWARKIGYTEKEYRELVARVGEVVERVKGWGVAEELGLGEALAVEKVSWVLGKEGVDCGEEAVVGEEVGGKGRKREVDDDEGEAGVENVKRAKKEASKREAPGQTEAVTKRKKSQVKKVADEGVSRRQTRSSARKKP